jgi:maleate cis-trans isomerase
MHAPKASRAILLRSHDNDHHARELAKRVPNVEWVDVSMPVELVGTVQTMNEQSQLHARLKRLIQPREPAELVVYSRAFGAFTSDARKALRDTFGTALVTAPSAVLDDFDRTAVRTLAVITPYTAARHDYELSWLRDNGLSVVADVGLGHDIGAAITAIDYRDLVNQVAKMPQADAVYIACTMISLDVLERVQSLTERRVVAATQSLVRAARLELAKL